MVIKALYSRLFLMLVPFLFKTLNVKIYISALTEGINPEHSSSCVFSVYVFAIQIFYSKIFIFCSGFVAQAFHLS